MKRALSTASIIAALLPTTISSASGAVQGWKIEHNSDFMGPYSVSVDGRSILITIPRHDVQFGMSAPEFQVLGINKKNKTFYTADYKAFSSHLRKGGNLENSSLLKNGSEKIAGQRAQHYFVKSPSWRPGVGVLVDGKPYDTEMFVSDSIKVPTQFVGLMVSIAECPSKLGYPLRIVCHHKDGKSTALNTIKILPGSAPPRLAQPKGFRKVDSEIALFAGDSPDDVPKLR